MKKKIIKLFIDTDFRIIGISTRLSAHKLSWLLNSELTTDFKQIDDLILKSTDSYTDLHHAVYEYSTRTGITYKLIENKNNTSILIKKLNNIDYLLKIEGDFSEKNTELLVKRIREIENIIACLNIQTQTFKQKELDLIR